MTTEEAIKILDPETRRKAMQKIHVWERIEKDQEACRIAVAALRAQQEAEKSESQGGWISVKDRLPADGYDVLAVVSGKPSENIELINAYVLASYEEDCGWFIEEYPDWENFRVTYWMPLPEPPREEPS